MSTELIKIIHLSDFHFSINSNGKKKSAKEISPGINLIKKGARRLFSPPVAHKLTSGINSHSIPAQRAIANSIQKIIQLQANKLVMIQTGDIEAYGATINKHGAISFPAIDYWDSICSQLKGKIDRFVSVFGNHDIWPGTLPYLRPGKTKYVERELRNRGNYQNPLPDVESLDYNQYRIEFYRMNTVCSNWIGNTFAVGQIKKDYQIQTNAKLFYPVSRSRNPVDELKALIEQLKQKDPRQIPIRILVMHHPPHSLKKRLANPGDLCAGILIHKKRLSAICKQIRFHVICAGHYHQTNPSLNHTASTKLTQHPLPGNTIQLVAGSATQAPGIHSKIRPNFSVYSLQLRSNNRHIRIERTVYHHTSDLDTLFSREPIETIVNNLPLQ